MPIASNVFLRLIATMNSKPEYQTEDKYVLRLPDGMRDRIKDAAKRSGRSMNQEIIQAIESILPSEHLEATRLSLLVPNKLVSDLEAQALYRSSTLHDEIVRLLHAFASGKLAEDDFGDLVKRLETAVMSSERLATELKDEVQSVAVISRWDTQLLEHCIEQYALKNELNRTDAILAVLRGWFADNGYLDNGNAPTNS